MSVMRQVQDLKKSYEQTQAELEQMTVTGSAGGGMVNAEVNGLLVVKRVKLDATIVKPDDIEMLEDLIVVAISEAQKKAMDEARLRTEKLTAGLPFKLPF